MRVTTDHGSSLLERSAEVEQATLLARDAADGVGSLLLVEAPAGVGKTALLRAMKDAVRGAGLEPLTASGDEFESGFPFGVALQLLGPAVRELDAPDRAAVLDGPAALAGPLFGTGDAGTSPDADAVVHGLYWLVTALADRGPLALLVDDAHWADGPSMRALTYLARRVGELPILLVVAARPTEPGPARPFLDRLSYEPGAEVSGLSPLSPEATASLVRAALEDADDAFCAACHEATGGNPFYVSELLFAVGDEKIPATAAGAPRLQQVTPRAVARSVASRLAALDGGAAALARAVATLGDPAPVHRAAALSELAPTEAQSHADALADAQILAPGRPLRFVHPIVRAAVADTATPAQASAAHARAAAVLRQDGAPVIEIAGHLVMVEPAGDAAVVPQLEDAARESLGRGSLEAAAGFLERALAEPPSPADRDRIELELGRIEVRLLRRTGPDRLRAALATLDDPARRTELTIELALALGFSRRVPEGLAVLEDARPGIRGDRDLEAAIDITGVQVARLDSATRAAAEERLARLREVYATDAAPPAVAVELARDDVNAGEPVGPIAASVRRAVRGLAELPFAPHAEAHCNAVITLLMCDDLETAASHSREIVADAQARGDVHAVAQFLQLIGIGAQRAGDLAAAEVELRRSLDVLEGWEFIAPASMGMLAGVLLDRGEIDEARAICASAPVEDEQAFTGLRYTRGRVRATDGDHAGALEDFRAVGALRLATEHVSTTPLHWRAHAARALHALGRTDEAIDLAEEELTIARRSEAPRSVGIALRARALISPPQECLALLQEATDVLAGSVSRVEEARARADLGAALRRANQRAAAREPLREALDLATRCGAGAVAELARVELVAAGARPRRAALSGVESLTPSERRACELAADGLTNRQVAQTLFVTVKTVEVHLRNGYAKLGITGRAELADAMAGLATPA